MPAIQEHCDVQNNTKKQIQTIGLLYIHTHIIHNIHIIFKHITFLFCLTKYRFEFIAMTKNVIALNFPVLIKNDKQIWGIHN